MPPNFRVAVYVHTDRWYVQPILGSTHPIRRSGQWEARIRFGLEFAVLLVAAEYMPERHLDGLPSVDGVEVFALARQ